MHVPRKGEKNKLKKRQKNANVFKGGGCAGGVGNAERKCRTNESQLSEAVCGGGLSRIGSYSSQGNGNSRISLAQFGDKQEKYLIKLKVCQERKKKKEQKR